MQFYTVLFYVTEAYIFFYYTTLGLRSTGHILPNPFQGRQQLSNIIIIIII